MCRLEGRHYIIRVTHCVTGCLRPAGWYALTLWVYPTATTDIRLLWTTPSSPVWGYPPNLFWTVNDQQPDTRNYDPNVQPKCVPWWRQRGEAGGAGGEGVGGGRGVVSHVPRAMMCASHGRGLQEQGAREVP